MKHMMASPLVDGVRCMILNEVPVLRNFKPVPNRIVQDILRGLPSMDGVLVVGNMRDDDMAQRTLDAVMDERGIPKFVFWVFDSWTGKPIPLRDRIELTTSYVNASGKNIKYCGHKIVKSEKQVEEYRAQMILAGHDDIMLRDLDRPYCIDYVPYVRDDSLFVPDGEA